MCTGRSSTGSGKLGRVLVLLVSLAGGAVASQVWVEDAPTSDAYVVTAVVLPGAAGAEVLGGDKGFDHVNFRVGFGPDLSLSVNGIEAGIFNPCDPHAVTVSCANLGREWFATTRIVSQATGNLIFEQVNYKMPGAPEQFRVVGEDVVSLEIR